MKKIVLTLAAVATLMAVNAQTRFTIQIQKTGVDGGVDVSSDDAEQENNQMDKLYDDDLDAGWEGDDFNTLSTGLRFRDITVPQGAHIDSAYIEVYSHEEENDVAKITIQGEATDDAQTFDLNNLLTDRNMTTAKTLWTVSEKWVIWTKYRTADFSNVVQEIVDRPGWASGNSMAFFLLGEDQGASNLDNARDMESFENEEDPDDGGDGKNHPERAPRLVIVYSTTTGTTEVSQKNQVSFYPNPVINGVIHINDLEANSTVSLLDLSGKVIDNLQESEGKFDVSHIASGHYVLRVESTQNVQTSPIIIQ